jgi:NADH:ubiquinone oxidoreductase subunit E
MTGDPIQSATETTDTTGKPTGDETLLHRQFNLRTQHWSGEEGKLIPLLQLAQATDGYLSREKIQEIHEKTGAPLAAIYGVATFYSQFRHHPVGKNIVRICHGTACHVNGANDITKAIQDTLQIGDGETTKDKLFTIETVACLGCCSLAPVIMVGNATHGKLNTREVRKLLKKYQDQGGAR